MRVQDHDRRRGAVSAAALAALWVSGMLLAGCGGTIDPLTLPSPAPSPPAPTGTPTATPSPTAGPTPTPPPPTPPPPTGGAVPSPVDIPEINVVIGSSWTDSVTQGVVFSAIYDACGELGPGCVDVEVVVDPDPEFESSTDCALLEVRSPDPTYDIDIPETPHRDDLVTILISDPCDDPTPTPTEAPVPTEEPSPTPTEAPTEAPTPTPSG
ncbi:hypothetical protein [Microbacterium hominis]|uniref:Uncharacterized protein n=1 Tax=Microbacterium hominis TaxID=162426 RepID=A0A7D4UH40_9MICO|nr:hypothetical protein [Microbacterium hominis]QKJ18028.1 hypothetical protein HQM25_00410 [Microbacterium hominis]